MNSVPVRYVFGGKQIGQCLLHDMTIDMIERLKSGELVFAPSFMQYPDGHLELCEVSIIPSSMMPLPDGIADEPMCANCDHSKSRHNTAGGFCKHCMCDKFVE